MSAVSKADVLETYSDLYDVFEDNKAICKELDKIYDRLNTLPSAQSDNGYSDGFADGYKRGLTDAQPEILYCKKCKHWTETCGDEQWGLGDCDVFDKHLVMCNGYCAWAERREE